MTKTCLQCGAVLPSNVRVCSFCESTLPAINPSAYLRAGAPREAAWKSELSERLASYRARRRKAQANENQSQFSFDHEEVPPVATRIAVDEPRLEDGSDDGFSFTIAIGRCGPSDQDKEMFIDVSQPPGPAESEQSEVAAPISQQQTGLYPVASMDERRNAAIIDGACLLFAYGGFLALFGSLGGQFTFSKMSATVYTIAFAIVYFQYFFLFTVFGGTTPGMMLRGLQVVDFSGEPAAPRKLLLRAAGYVLSAGTFFLGFLWALWDEDELTWHDRISRTYLSPIQSEADTAISGAVHGHF